MSTTDTHTIRPPALSAPDPQAATDADLTALETAITETRRRIAARSGRIGLRQMGNMLGGQPVETRAATLLSYEVGRVTYPVGQEG